MIKRIFLTTSFEDKKKVVLHTSLNACIKSSSALVIMWKSSSKKVVKVGRYQNKKKHRKEHSLSIIIVKITKYQKKDMVTCYYINLQFFCKLSITKSLKLCLFTMITFSMQTMRDLSFSKGRILLLRQMKLHKYWCKVKKIGKLRHQSEMILG